MGLPHVSVGYSKRKNCFTALTLDAPMRSTCSTRLDATNLMTTSYKPFLTRETLPYNGMSSPRRMVRMVRMVGYSKGKKREEVV